MNIDKLDSRLINEIQYRRIDKNISLEEMAKEKFEVSIELVESLIIPKGLSREEALENLKAQAVMAQAGVVSQLESENVTEFERQFLTNTINATLTLDQIQSIALRNDVRIIRLVKDEYVAL